MDETVYLVFKILFAVANLIIQGHFILIEKNQAKRRNLSEYF